MITFRGSAVLLSIVVLTVVRVSLMGQAPEAPQASAAPPRGFFWVKGLACALARLSASASALREPLAR